LTRPKAVFPRCSLESLAAPLVKHCHGGTLAANVK
jgi:hypothetical protein